MEADLLAPPTDEEMGQAILAPPSKEELDTARLAPPTEDEVLTAEQQNLDFNVSGERSSAVAKNFETGVEALGAATSSATAAGEFYDRENGWLENTFYTLTIPEQFMARQAINILENSGAMSMEEARDLISRDQVHGSDIVNFYWRDPQNWYGKVGRFTTGLAADILIDPLSYVGVGALTKLGKAAVVGDKTITGLGKMSKAERAYYKTLQSVEKVVASDGSFQKAGMSALETAEQNSMALARARDMDLAAPDAVMSGLAQLESQLMVSPEAAKELTKQIASGMTEKSFAREWYEGSRGLTFGARVPFTDIAFEVDMPGHISRLPALPLMALDGTFDFAKTLIRSNGWGDAAFQLVSDLGTRTGKFVFDLQQNAKLGQQTVLKEELGAFEKESRRVLAVKQQNMGDRFPQLVQDIVDEMENPDFAYDEAAKLAEDFGKDAQAVLDLVETGKSATNLERRARLAEHPEIVDLIDDMRSMMKETAAAYKARGLPFEELNPFGPGWATGYLKHEVSDQFVRKMKEVNEADDIVKLGNEQLEAIAAGIRGVESRSGSATTVNTDLVGKADQSSRGRSYRGTIRDANLESMEKFGVKMFVDDPIELITKRKEEMEKVLRDHDLMKAAMPYAVTGKNPGVGYVKFSIEDFGRTVIDQSDGFKQQYDAFIPKELKTGQSFYFPEDVYDRMDFSINGWKTSKPMAKVLTAADFYTRVWRNNALFGPSYLGMNAFSNALTYLSFNDRGGPAALAKATMMMTPAASKVMIKTPHMGELTAEAVMKLAHENNLLGSSFSQGMEFKNLAEHVASNREARKTLGQKAMTVADYAYLWRANRATAQFADDVPKLATFVSRLEKGYSVKGAAETAERYFYNFNNMSRIQAGTARLIPFTSFPMKTAEAVYETVKSGRLAGLTIPGKVQAALDGAYVQDHETRKAMDMMLPGFKNVLHPIHGELMPGMRELQVDVPWTYGTLDTLFHPEKMNHPLAQLLMLAGSYNSGNEEQWAEGDYQRKQLMAANIDMWMPAYARDALTLAEINGAMDFGGFFKDRYAALMPTKAQFERGLDPGRDTLDKSTIYQKFQNAADFGEAMDKKYGENWFYNAVFHNRVDAQEDEVAMQEAGIRGEWIRRRMRQFSLGLVSMNKLDSNFFMNTFAIKRQIDIKKRALKAEIVKEGALMDTSRIDEPEFLKRMEAERPLAKELLALNHKLESLGEYYNFFLGADKIDPNINVVDIMFGTREYQFDNGDKPEKDVYRKLYKRQTEKNLPNEDADEVIDDIYTKDSL